MTHLSNHFYHQIIFCHLMHTDSFWHWILSLSVDKLFEFLDVKKAQDGRKRLEEFSFLAFVI